MKKKKEKACGVKKCCRLVAIFCNNTPGRAVLLGIEHLQGSRDCKSTTAALEKCPRGCHRKRIQRMAGLFWKKPISTCKFNSQSFKKSHEKMSTSLNIQFSSVQFISVAQLCPTLCNPVNRSTPGLPVHHQLPEFTQTHVRRISDAIQPSHPLSSPSPPAPNPSQHQSLFQ